MLGATIDLRYRVLRELGRGGMGTVYEAEHVGTGRRVAVKVVNAGIAASDEMVTRFQREARAAGAIETPHIVQVLDTGTDASTGVIYMVMEVLRGEDLQQLTRRIGPISPDLALRLVGQACRGLAKAHDADVIHRDLKPANLFLTSSENGAITVKLVDFGIAKIKGNVTGLDETALTRTEGMLGTPRYMSPEQVTSSKRVDRRTDIWSLGVVLYQAITGEWPHDADNLGTLILSICSEPARPIQALAPWVPPEIARLVHRALAPRPDDRFESAGAMLDAICKLLPGGLSIQSAELVPLTEALRSSVAHRAPLEAHATPVGRASMVSATQGNLLPKGEAGLSISRLGSSSFRGRRSLAFRWLALSAVLGGGLVLYQLFGRPTITPGAEPSPPAARASASPEAAAEPRIAPRASSEKRAERLAVEPAGVTVEVDDREQPVQEGAVEVLGAVGTMHRVRLRKDGQEKVVKVVIAASGVYPSKVGLDVAKATTLKGSTNSATTSAGGGRPGVAYAPKTSTASTSRTRNEKPTNDPAPARTFD